MRGGPTHRGHEAKVRDHRGHEANLGDEDFVYAGSSSSILRLLSWPCHETDMEWYSPLEGRGSAF